MIHNIKIMKTEKSVSLYLYLLTIVLLGIHAHQTLVLLMETLCSLFVQFLVVNLLMIDPHVSILALTFCNAHTKEHKTIRMCMK